MANYKKILIALLLLFLFPFLRSEDKKALAFYPYGAYSKETGGFLGGYMLYIYRPNKLPENYKPSSLELDLMFSFKQQLRILVRNKLNLSDGRYGIGIPIRYFNWPTTYFGIGNQKKTDKMEKYTKLLYEFYPYFEYHFQKIFVLAASVYLENNKITKSENDNDLLNDDIAGFEDYFLSGIEIKLGRLTTDNNFFPTRGSDIALSTKLYHKFLGSDYGFRNLTLDFRKYFPVSDDQTLAAQVLLNSLNGDPPFEKLPDLGNEMRGFDDNVYINDHYFLCRLENRIFPWHKDLWRRIGFAGFLESGQSFHTFSGIKSVNEKFSAGLGLRFILLPSEKFTLRCDAAWSRDGYEIEITSYEAF